MLNPRDIHCMLVAIVYAYTDSCTILSSYSRWAAFQKKKKRFFFLKKIYTQLWVLFFFPLLLSVLHSGRTGGAAVSRARCSCGVGVV